MFYSALIVVAGQRKHVGQAMDIKAFAVDILHLDGFTNHLTLLLVGFLEYVNPITGGGGANRPPSGFSYLYQKPFALAP